MNFTFSESLSSRPRCRHHWLPLLSQQLRLRHVYQIIAYNLTSSVPGRFYYTLHLTAMSAPFYTSEKCDGVNPKWPEIIIDNLPNLSNTAFVLRIWQERQLEMDVSITTIGVNLSGLVYLGSKLFCIQPEHFTQNTVIFSLRGGYFTSYSMLRTDLPKPPPFIDHLNIVSSEDSTKIIRNVNLSFKPSAPKHSYNISKLQRIHSLQISIRNKTAEVERLREKINKQSGLAQIEMPRSDSASTSKQDEGSVRYEPQLLTMNTLTKMLQGQPPHMLKKECLRISKEIEVAQFRTRLLSREKDRNLTALRHLKGCNNKLTDQNEERNSQLMENYHALNKNGEKLKEWKQILSHHKEHYTHCSHQLHHRRRQLLQELLFIYPIRQVGEHKFTLNGIHLPNSDVLTDCSDGGLAVALGYATHLLTMCSIFLQIPLRHPMIHYGSRSHIIDHITPTLSDKERSFALYKTSKEQTQFSYAVYLLNRNVAQLRFLCGLHTPELKATLANLLGLLQGKGYQVACASVSKPNAPNAIKSDENHKRDIVADLHNFAPQSGGHDPILDSLKGECQLETDGQPGGSHVRRLSKTRKVSDCGPGLCEILALPEAFLNREIGTDRLRQYVISGREKKQTSLSSGFANYEIRPKMDHASQRIKIWVDTSSRAQSESAEPVEKGTDVVEQALNGTLILEDETGAITVTDSSNYENCKTLSRSVDSYNDEMRFGVAAGFGSTESVLQSRLQPNLAQQNHEITKNLTDSGGSGARLRRRDSPPLTARVDALLSTKSFNLLEPKY